jgi:hypothetical protein
VVILFGMDLTKKKDSPRFLLSHPLEELNRLVVILRDNINNAHIEDDLRISRAYVENFFIVSFRFFVVSRFHCSVSHTAESSFQARVQLRGPPQIVHALFKFIILH